MSRRMSYPEYARNRRQREMYAQRYSREKRNTAGAMAGIFTIITLPFYAIVLLFKLIFSPRQKKGNK